MNNNPRDPRSNSGSIYTVGFSVVLSRFEKSRPLQREISFTLWKFKFSDWRRLEFPRLSATLLKRGFRAEFPSMCSAVGVVCESDTVLCLCISLGSAVPAMQLPQLPGDTHKSVPDDELIN